MPEVIGVSSWIIAGWVWGDWRNWRKYESTILFMILLDTLYYYVSQDHRLWTLEPQAPFRTEFAALLGEFIVFASAVLMFLGRFPKGLKQGLLWTLLWIAIFSANEALLLVTGTFSYSNGWTLFDSIVFCFLMFPVLRLHHVKPLAAYALSIPACILYIYYYNISIH
ncbi:CBO0543 family protein [Paenibacillus silvisoli]|uniref:CBO0543 family protein n=1 Tax=Paenibacillus silvisoli TaxID=3110539 RepID=UPI0028049824|nr:CBO0543 family protein [Paenibacillus silvisoli]